MNVYSIIIFRYLFCFFFQAEDGIRDWSVTGVQTCALPISSVHDRESVAAFHHGTDKAAELLTTARALAPDLLEQLVLRSEERRVGKECRTRWARGRSKKRKKGRQSNRCARHTAVRASVLSR